MKANEIKVGDHYIAKVGVNIAVVTVDSINKRDGYRPAGYGQRGFAGRTTYSVTNVKTGRTTMFESASKFRRAATVEEIRKAKGIAAPANPAFKVDQPRGIDTYRAAQEKAKLGSNVPAPTGNIHTPNGYVASMTATDDTPAAQPVEGEPTFVVASLRRVDGAFRELLYLVAAYRDQPAGWTADPTAASRFVGKENYLRAAQYVRDCEKFGLLCFIHCEHFE